MAGVARVQALASRTNPSHKLTLWQCTTPFEVSSFDRVSDRKSLGIRANDEIVAFCERLDKELLKHAGQSGCNESGYTRLLNVQKEG